MASLRDFHQKLLRSYNPNLCLDLTGPEERRYLRLALDENHDTLAMIEWQIETRAALRRKLLRELEEEVAQIVSSALWRLRLPSALVPHYNEVAYLQAMRIIKARQAQETEAAREISSIRRRLLARSPPIANPTDEDIAMYKYVDVLDDEPSIA